MMQLSAVTNKKTGITFMVRIVEEGDKYGRNFQLSNDSGNPMIEFYDVRYKFDEYQGIIFGQFVSRYYVKTLMENGLQNGLNLEGGVSDWQLDVDACKEVIALLKRWGF